MLFLKLLEISNLIIYIFNLILKMSVKKKLNLSAELFFSKVFFFLSGVKFWKSELRITS